MQIRITRLRLVVLGLLVLGVAGYLLWDYAVVTEPERIETVIVEVAGAVEAGDFEACAAHMDDSCRLMGRPIPDIRKLCEQAMKAFPITDADPYEIDVTMDANDPDRATAKVVAAFVLRDYQGEYKIDWKLAFVRRDGHNWRLTDITPYRHGTRDPVYLAQIEWLLR